MDAIGVADRNTLAGVVRMHSACLGAGMRPLIGCRLDLEDAPSLLAYPIGRDGYGRLSRLLSLGKMRSDKGACDLTLIEVADHADNIAFIVMPGEDLDAFTADLPRLKGGRCRCAMSPPYICIAAMIWRGSSGWTGWRGRWRHYPRDQRRPLPHA
jgi:error-prone DNA polymerase